MNLASITTIQIPPDLVEHTDRALRDVGTRRREAFVLWSGIPAGEDRVRIRAVHVPEQTSYSFESGLCVRVEGPELHRLNVWLYENTQILTVQIHTHPTEAYHSETDDAYPIVTALGGVSIVVPDFCKRGLLGSGVATYRLNRNGWTELPRGALSKLLEVD